MMHVRDRLGRRMRSLAGNFVEGEPGFRRILSDLRRKSTAECLGRSPGSEVQSVLLCGCLTFPGEWPSGRSKQRPHSQWRDRAGFAPDFPVMPLVGTQTRLAL